MPAPRGTMLQWVLRTFGTSMSPIFGAYRFTSLIDTSETMKMKMKSKYTLIPRSALLSPSNVNKFWVFYRTQMSLV